MRKNLRPSVVTHRLELRPYKISDFIAWEVCLSGVERPKNQYDRKIPKNWKPTRNEFLKLVKRQEKEAAEGIHFAWPIFEKKSGAVLGVCDVTLISRGNLQVANLGYFIDNNYWGRGIGSEAVRALIPRALKVLNLNRLEAVIDVGNRRSVALARKVGMRREGLRRNFYYQNGAWADQVVFVADRFSFGISTLHPSKY